MSVRNLIEVVLILAILSAPAVAMEASCKAAGVQVRICTYPGQLQPIPKRTAAIIDHVKSLFPDKSAAAVNPIEIRVVPFGMFALHYAALFPSQEIIGYAWSAVHCTSPLECSVVIETYSILSDEALVHELIHQLLHTSAPIANEEPVVRLLTQRVLSSTAFRQVLYDGGW